MSKIRRSALGAACIVGVLAAVWVSSIGSTGGTPQWRVGNAFASANIGTAIDVPQGAFLGIGPRHLFNDWRVPVVLLSAIAVVSGGRHLAARGDFLVSLNAAPFFTDQEGLSIDTLRHRYISTETFRPLVYRPFPGLVCLRKGRCVSLSCPNYLVAYFVFTKLGPVTVDGFELSYRARDQLYREYFPQQYELSVITQADFRKKFHGI